MPELMRLIMAAALVFVLAGCSTVNSRATEHVSWRGDETLGRVVLLVELDQVGPERRRPAKTAEVHDIVRNALESMYGTAMLDATHLFDGEIESAGWKKSSEYELIAAARERGIDTIGTLQVDRYVGSSGIALLPPGWWAETVIAYRLRLLDVATGEVLADVERARRRGGYFGWAGPSDLPRDLREDLADLIAARIE